MLNADFFYFFIFALHRYGSKLLIGIGITFLFFNKRKLS